MLGRVARRDQMPESLAMEHRLADEVEQDIELLGGYAHRTGARGLGLGSHGATIHDRLRGSHRGLGLSLLHDAQRRSRGRARGLRGGGLRRLALGCDPGRELGDQGSDGVRISRLVAVDERPQGVACAQQRIGETGEQVALLPGVRRVHPRRRGRAR